MDCVECRRPLVKIRSSEVLACLSWKDHKWLARGKWLELSTGVRLEIGEPGELGFRGYPEGASSWEIYHYEDLSQIGVKAFPPKPKERSRPLPLWIHEGAKVFRGGRQYTIGKIYRQWVSLRAAGSGMRCFASVETLLCNFSSEGPASRFDRLLVEMYAP